MVDRWLALSLTVVGGETGARKRSVWLVITTLQFLSKSGCHDPTALGNWFQPQHA